MMEYLDAIKIDDLGNEKVVGKFEKHEIHDKKLLHRFIAIMIFNSKGQLLSQKIKSSKKRGGDQYGLSVAGHVTSGSSYEETATRELREELGIDNLNLEYLFSIEEKGNESYHENMIGNIYKLTHDGPFSGWEREAEELKWFDIDELKENINNTAYEYTLTQAFKNALEKYFNYIKV